MSEQIPETTPQRDPSGWRRGRRRWLAVASLALVVGALVIGGTVAAESGTSTTGGGLRDSFLSHLADNLGISRDKLDQAITTSSDQTIDQAVANGDLTQQQGDALKERLANGDLFTFGARHGRPGRALFGHGDGMATIASTLGITTADLRSELQAGSTLEQVITNHGSTVDAVVQSLVNAARTDLDQAVAKGKLTQALADKILSNLPARLTEMIQNGFGHRAGGGHHWQNPDNASPDATPQASPTD